MQNDRRPRNRHLAAAAIAIALVTTATSARAENPTPEQLEIREAAWALYGHGLSIKLTDGGKRVALDYTDKMTRPKLERFIEKYWVPALAKVQRPHRVSDFRFDDTTDRKLRGQLGYVMVEPKMKLALCRQIAKLIKDDKYADNTQYWCHRKAVFHATTALYAFRGEPVVYERDKEVAGMKLDEPMWRKNSSGKRDILLVLNGSRLFEKRWGAVQVLKSLASELSSQRGPYAKDGAKALERVDRAEAIANKRMKKFHRKVFGRGAGIALSDRWTSPWQTYEPVKSGAIKCDAIRINYRPPSKTGAQQANHLVVKLNGKLCSEEMVYGPNIGALWLANMCKGAVYRTTNRVEVSLHSNVNKRTGSKYKVRGDSIEKRGTYSNNAGKKVASKQVSCSL